VHSLDDGIDPDCIGNMSSVGNSGTPRRSLIRGPAIARSVAGNLAAALTRTGACSRPVDIRAAASVAGLHQRW
jgi:hypothetical protein